jgi:cyclophilin family peptidyl-prolyl cis-trans isomerase
MHRNVVRLLAALCVAVLGAPVQAQDTQPARAAGPVVELSTSRGTIVLELNEQQAPVSTRNFLQYVRAGDYDGTIFHRVIPGFMIQGGGFTAAMEKKDTREPIVNEAKNGLKNDRGTIAMARTNDPNSATSQFFINVVDNQALNPSPSSGAGYAVFGRVIEGMDVVDAIVGVRTTTRGGHQNVPVEPIAIQSARVRE